YVRSQVAVTTRRYASQALVRLAAPQPVGVSQVWKAHLAASGSAVAYGTVVGEQALADFHGVFVLGQFRNGGVTVLGIDFAVFLVSLGNFCFPLVSRSPRSEEHTSELQSRENLVCRLLLEKKKKHK